MLPTGTQVDNKHIIFPARGNAVTKYLGDETDGNHRTPIQDIRFYIHFVVMSVEPIALITNPKDQLIVALGDNDSIVFTVPSDFTSCHFRNRCNRNHRPSRRDNNRLLIREVNSCTFHSHFNRSSPVVV